MIWLLAGLGGALFLYALLRAFAYATPAQAKQFIVVGGSTLGALLLALILLTGRASMAFTGLILFGPALWRWWKGMRAKQVFSRGAGPGETAVDTATLEMRLDLSSGEMQGRVRRGAYAGSALAELSLERLLALLADCETEDPESVPLLQAWLDRVAPEWRVPPPAIDRAAALSLLGLAEGAGEAEIRAAHRQAMRAAHPDAGGDAVLASRLNAARDLLLGD